MVSKSDFLLFLESPLHLWAKAHKKMNYKEPTDFGRFLSDQGYDVEAQALKFIHQILLPRYPHAELLWQHTYHDGNFISRSDAIIHDKKDNVFDIYEIKQSTKVDKENEYDITYQTLIYEANFPVRNVHILHLNKEYVRHGELDLEQLFVITNVNDKVAYRKPEVLMLREQAYLVTQSDAPNLDGACTKPPKCPCPDICHPDLPEFPIYDLMGARCDKLTKLRDAGVIHLIDIDHEVNLNDKQEHQIEAVRSHSPYIDHAALVNEINNLTFPIYFLDYETCGLAIPGFDGYKPQQPMVFQYSLHKLEESGTLAHTEYLSITQADPSLPLVKQLATEIGSIGSILVWNKTFEMSRNKEMAERYLEYKQFLENVNERIYDLADPVRKGMIIHPNFHGSWSIKNVLPVLVPGLSYDGLDVRKGDQAMVAWIKLIYNIDVDDEPDWIKGNDNENLKQAMLEYCELDTVAMVEIWKKLSSISQAS